MSLIQFATIATKFIMYKSFNNEMFLDFEIWITLLPEMAPNKIPRIPTFVMNMFLVNAVPSSFQPNLAENTYDTGPFSPRTIPDWIGVAKAYTRVNVKRYR